MKRKVLITLMLILCLLVHNTLAQTIRYATATDIATIPNANLGDLLITGGTETSNGLPAIWLGPTSSWPITAGKKILIKGGIYDFIIIHNTSSGVAGSPITITNYGGQVETKNLTIKGMRYFKLTGKYDPNNKTGDINYQGHTNGYAWTQGKYGIFVNNKWTDDNAFLIEITGFVNGTTINSTSNYEVEYIESGNGGFSNVFKFNDQIGIVDSIKIHDVYFHDTDGEGIYLGNSATTQQQVIKNLQFYNNRIIRAGNDGLQLNNIVEGSNIYNNVIVNSGMGWRDPFMEWQDFGSSLSFNNGGVVFKNNIIVGGGGQIYQSYLTQETSYPITPSGSVLFKNNLFMYSKNMGVFLGPEADNLIGVSQDIQNNYFGKIEYLYNLVYGGTNGNWVYQSYYNGVVKLQSNKWDGSANKTVFYTYSYVAPQLNAENIITTIDDIRFSNYMGDGFNYNKFEYWASKTTVGSSIGSTITYPVGWYVSWKSKIYKCIQQATNIQPGVTANWQTYWQLITFNNGTSYYPADDVRIPTTSVYNSLKMGLLDNPENTLPIKWVLFDAIKDKNQVKLNWNINSDESLTFIIERNISNKWEVIGETKLNSFIDINPKALNQYRIKAISITETIYSTIRVVNFPNKSLIVKVDIYNTLGQIIRKQVVIGNVKNIGLVSGIYILKQEDGTYSKIFIE